MDRKRRLSRRPTQASGRELLARWLRAMKPKPRPRFALSESVELLEATGPSRGRVVGTLDDGRVYVRWAHRTGCDTRVTLERAAALRGATGDSVARAGWSIGALLRRRARVL